jgi:hypothetical protein
LEVVCVGEHYVRVARFWKPPHRRTQKHYRLRAYELRAERALALVAARSVGHREGGSPNLLQCAELHAVDSQVAQQGLDIALSVAVRCACGRVVGPLRPRRRASGSSDNAGATDAANAFAPDSRPAIAICLICASQSSPRATAGRQGESELAHRHRASSALPGSVGPSTDARGCDARQASAITRRGALRIEIFTAALAWFGILGCTSSKGSQKSVDIPQSGGMKHCIVCYDTTSGPFRFPACKPHQTYVAPSAVPQARARDVAPDSLH